MTALISIGVSIALLGTIFFFTWLIVKITEFCIERHYAKLRKKHPKLYEMCAECDALSDKKYKEWHKRYYEPKIEIDKILGLMSYFPKEKKEEEEKHLEELRHTMADYLREGNPYDEQIDKLRERIEEYARKNNLKSF